jgi:hypothetical protein
MAQEACRVVARGLVEALATKSALLEVSWNLELPSLSHPVPPLSFIIFHWLQVMCSSSSCSARA